MAAWNRGEWARGCQRLSRGDDGKLVWSFTSRVDPKTGVKGYTLVQGWPTGGQTRRGTASQGPRELKHLNDVFALGVAVESGMV